MHNSTGKTPTYTLTHTPTNSHTHTLGAGGRVTGAFTSGERCQDGHRSDISEGGLHPVLPAGALPSSPGFCSASDGRMTGADSLSSFI